ncbi:MAG: glycogen debranching enzyme N-terminal domain-containing protein, partial [Thermomicrobiales bacterium]|nr:glycogen debranching enzyme N-terminal domain-containing protein [Thermomicrobiales bacterium]
MSRTILDDPIVSFGREVCGELGAALRREWLVTNGIGGYASGTLIGVSSRSYHGLLVAALDPPVSRIVLVGGSVEQATYRGRRYPISTNEYADGVLVPDGHRHLAGFRLEGTLPVWTYAIADALIERRLWMPDGMNTTYLSYHLLHAGEPVELEITPLITYRDHHILTSGQGWQMQVERHPHGELDRAFEDAAPLRLLTDTGEFRSAGRWYWNFRYREEAARGFRDHGDLYAPGSFSKRLEPGETLTVIYSVENDVDLDGARTLDAERLRQRDLLARASVEQSPPAVQQLVLAADQFLVRRVTTPRPADRPDTPPDMTRTTIAGYHWFIDWGRATMVSLPGLTLATGRHDDAAEILRSFATYLQDGLLPNRLPDLPGGDPAYNTADVTLWFVQAVEAYRRATGDEQLVDDLLPALVEIVERHLAGTHFGIGVDPADGLLRAGLPESQVTWMDAKVDNWIVTPRTGKPVEINALWHNALRIVAEALTTRGDERGTELATHADRARTSFLARFVPPGGGPLADVVDGPNGDDWTLRPNQLFALTLSYPLLDGDRARSALAAVGRALLTTHGLRSLDPDDADYTGGYGGNRAERDAALHQGSVWPWLIGAYVDAVLRLTGDRDRVERLLTPFAHH